MDTGKVQDISTGNSSHVTPTPAHDYEKAVKRSQPAPIKPVPHATLQTLADILSQIQEDCRLYNETLAEFLPDRLPVFMKFNIDGLIYLSAPPNHALGTGTLGTGKQARQHITLDGKPVTGWSDTDKKGTGKK